MARANRRLWAVEKPLWFFVKHVSGLWKLTNRVWVGLMKFWNQDSTSLVVLCSYAVGGTLLVSLWPPTSDWLGIHRTVDIILMMVFMLWGLIMTCANIFLVRMALLCGILKH